MLNVFIKAELTVLYYLQAPIITSPYTIRLDSIFKNLTNMQLSAIRQRGGVEGVIIMHVSASYHTDWHRTVVVQNPVVSEHTTYIHMCCVLCPTLHHIVCDQFP